MTAPIRWKAKQSAVGFKVQDDYATPQSSGSPTWLLVDSDVSVELARESKAINLLEGQFGATSAPLVGSKHGGKVKFKCPLRTVPGPPTGTGYTDVAPELQLIALALSGECPSGGGLSPIQSILKDFSASTAAVIGYAPSTRTISLDTSASVPLSQSGNFVLVTGSDGSTVVNPAWSTAIVGGGARVVTLFERGRTDPAAGNRIGASLTISSAGPVATAGLTLFYQTDEVGATALRLTGCVVESLTISLDPKQIPMVEFAFVFTDYAYVAKTSGEGAHTPTSNTRVAPLIDANGARLVLGAKGNDSGLEGALSSLKVTITNELKYIESHVAAQGVSECIIAQQKIAVAADVVLDMSSSGGTGIGPTMIDEGFESGGTMPLALSVGKNVGQVFAVFCPSLRTMQQPVLTNKDGVLVYRLAWEAATYSGDFLGSTPNPSWNSLFRIGIG